MVCLKRKEGEFTSVINITNTTTEAIAKSFWSIEVGVIGPEQRENFTIDMLFSLGLEMRITFLGGEEAEELSG